MRRILLLIKGLGRGGAERLLVAELRHADRDRFAYEVGYVLPWKDALVGEAEAAGATVHVLGGGRGLGWVRRLASLVRERRIDLVHVHSPYVAAGARTALRRPLPLVYTEHNVWQRYHRATYWANALTYPRNDHVFAVSDQVRSSVRYPAALRFRRTPPIETLYHGPDPAALAAAGGADGVRAELGVPEDAPLVGVVANLKPHKGHAHLLRAALRVRAAVPEARIVLVGQGPLEADLKRQARDLGVNGMVLFAGYREDALRVMAALDLFVLPSLHEGLSIALLEAMALGKPPVVTAVGGHPEVVQHGVSGLVVPPADPAALAHGIVELLEDRPYRDRLGEAARRRAARFDMKEAVRRMEEVYEELLR